MAKDITSGSGVLDDMLSSTECDHTQITSETEDLTTYEDSPFDGVLGKSTARTKPGEKRRRKSSHVVRISDPTANFAPRQVSSTKLNSVNQKIDLLMTMMKDIAPVVKTLNTAYEGSLLDESDEDSINSEASPPKQIKLTTDTTKSEAPRGVIYSLVSEVNTEKKTGPVISEKIAKALDNLLR